MKNKQVLILTVEEAREALVQWYTDMIVSDRGNVVDHVREGRLGQIMPKLNEYSPSAVAEQFGELNLGEEMTIHSGVDQILVELDAEHYVVVWDILNLEPK